MTRRCFATHDRLARPRTPEWHGRQASGVADDFALPGAVRSGNFTAGMELREFAERVVFGTTLEDKLFRPETFTDTRPGSAWESPKAPGRPDVLRFKAPGTATTTDSFPGLHRLDHGSERGKVLHFFANHELLATELMALVLLRFPDAPPAFRRGVLRTLQDEQDHVRLYLERMKACGVVFGELPVSGYFWRSVAPMRSPMDFVSGLSLTFEQANLDFSRTFGRAFAEAGDADTAALLDRIHRDEIAHVAHGLKWFRRWKETDETDWNAFQRVLRTPLSPRRARGDDFNVEGRRSAGLEDDFIRRLEAFSRSKGRTPDVFLFNPLAEGHIGLGPAFNPGRHALRLAEDLALLPQYLGSDDDVVLVPATPSAEFLAGLRRHGLPVAECVPFAEMGSLADRKLGSLRPWAWSPDSVARLAPLALQVTGGSGLPDPGTTAARAALFGKDWSAALLRELQAELEAIAPPGRLSPAWSIGTVAREPAAVWEAVDRIRATGHHRIVVKRSLGLAGGNAIRLWEPAPLPAQRVWVEESFRHGGSVVVEPWMERLCDFSAQFDRADGTLRLRGYTGLTTDRRGQFLANTAEPAAGRRPPAAVLAAFRGRDPRWIHRIFERIQSALQTAFDAAGHHGPAGVDAFVHEGPDGPCLRPLVELNPRLTMGRVLLELTRFVAPGHTSRLRLLNPSQLRALGHPDFVSLMAAWEKLSPPQREGRPVPRLTRGIVPLNDPATAMACLAVLEVGDDALRPI